MSDQERENESSSEQEREEGREAVSNEFAEDTRLLTVLKAKLDELMDRVARGERLTDEEAQRAADFRDKINNLEAAAAQRTMTEFRQRPEFLEAQGQTVTAAQLRHRLETDETLPPGLKNQLETLLAQKEQQEYYAAMNPLRTAQLQPHWTPDQQKEWFHHQMKLLLETRKGPGVAENEVLWQLIKSATAILQKNPELKEEYEALMTFYEHFSVLTSSTDLEPIVSHASHIKAEDMMRMLRLPFVSRAVKLWEEHASYKEFLGAKTPKDKNGRLLGSVINLTGPALELRKLYMAGEMAKERLIYELARKKAIDSGIEKDHHGHEVHHGEFEPPEHLLEEARREVERRLGERGDLSLAFLDKYVHETPDEHDPAMSKEEKAAHDKTYNLETALGEVPKQKRILMEKIQQFVEESGLDNEKYIPESFFTSEGENMEQVLSRGERKPDERRRRRGESIFEEAQLSLYSGESIWRTFERAAFFDGENPNAYTSEGGGENPLRRLLHQRKYAQELLRDGKIKHADYHIVEHLTNPTRDFMSDGGDSFWKAQPEPVRQWYQKMLDTPGKIDKYGRFTDMSECPFELIDFRLYQDIPDRSPLYPHYSNFLSLAEELRKQEELKPGALLETPTMENYKNFVRLYRNLRSEDVLENKESRERAKATAAQGKGRPPLPSREEASYELFKGLMSYWKDNGIMDDESITNAILSIADAYQESFITPKYMKMLLREHLGPFWGTWPMWELRQTWGKIDWGAGFMGLVKGLFKGVSK